MLTLIIKIQIPETTGNRKTNPSIGESSRELIARSK